jgi:hypothetical protein
MYTNLAFQGKDPMSQSMNYEKKSHKDDKLYFNINQQTKLTLVLALSVQLMTICTTMELPLPPPQTNQRPLHLKSATLQVQ